MVRDDIECIVCCYYKSLNKDTKVFLIQNL